MQITEDNIPLVSIIIAVYNAEKYLGRCLDSILNQSDSDYEVIIVNDGSTDSTALVIAEYAGKSKAIRHFYQDNSGPGPSRNLGIVNSKGRYLWFVDSDDELKPNSLSTLKKSLYKNVETDVVVFNYEEVNIPLKRSLNVIIPKVDSEHVRDYFIDRVLSHWTNNGFLWNKVYKREVVISNNIEIGNGRYQEDFVFNLRVFQKIKSVVCISDILYRYYIFEPYYSRKYYPFVDSDLFEVNRELIRIQKYFNDKKVLYHVGFRLMKNMKYCLIDNIFLSKNSLSWRKKKKRIKEILKGNCYRESYTYVTEKIVRGGTKKERFLYRAILNKDVSVIYWYGVYSKFYLRLRNFFREFK